MTPGELLVLAGVADEMNRCLKEKCATVKIVDGHIWLTSHSGNFVKLDAYDDAFEIVEV